MEMVAVVNTQPRIVQLATAYDVEVPAHGTVEALVEIPCGDFPYQRISWACSEGVAHDVRIGAWYKFFAGDKFVVNENALRGATDWFEAENNVVTVCIYNDSDETHKYNVGLVGIR